MQQLYNVCIVEMAWEVEYTDQFEEWWRELTQEQQESMTAAVTVLSERGPGLGRPLVDTLTASRHPNMKELRVLGTLRAFFAFDPRRTALLLVGGDKRDEGEDWYQRMLAVADDLYDDHLIEIAKERDG